MVRPIKDGSTGLSRRNLMKIAGSGAIATGLAGCAADEGDGGGGNGGEGNGGGGNGGGSAGHFLAGAPQSGPAALPGNHVMNGMELRYQEMLDQGEFDPAPEGIFENSECSAETAVGYTTDALARHDDLFAWVGGYCSPETLSTMDTTEQEQLLQIVTSFAPEVTESGHPYTFRVAPSSRIVVPPSVDYAINELDAQRHAIIGLNNDWGISETEEWERQAEDAGAEVVYFEHFPGDQSDFSSQATQIAGEDPDVIFALGYHGHTANLLQTFDEQGLNAGENVEVFIGTVAGHVLSQAVEPEHIENVYSPTYYIGPGFANYPEEAPDHMVEFQEKYSEEYGEDTIRESAIGYALIETMAQAMQEVDGNYADNVPEMAEGLRGRDEPFMTPFGPIVFDDMGQADLPIFIAQHDEDGEMFIVQEPQ